MEMIEIPPADYSKERGIRGIIQIATQTIDHHTYSERVEIVARYFTKFEQRMRKAGTPLDDTEKDQIINTLRKIIAKTPTEEKEEP